MSLQDPIADMLTRIMNGQARLKREVRIPSSKVKAAIAGILEEEGYITGHRVSEEGGRRILSIELKYFEGRPVIETLQRVSRPGLRRYRAQRELPRVMNGMGTAIISTSRGLLTDRKAREQGVGGEVLCIVA
jgi:small subunit ribosomal protein S8